MKNNSSMASTLISEFCNFLKSRGISVDSEERLKAVNESEFEVSPIYGSDYEELHIKIESILTDNYGDLYRMEVKNV